jgi:selenocysteine lyase/cysteine desulfurase
MNLEDFRKEFPITEKYIYLDHAGIAPISRRVVSSIERFLSEAMRSGAFLYPEWTKKVVEVRRSAARLINAAEDEIAFVRSTSHGLSLIAAGLDWRQGDNVLIYEKEFPSNLYPWVHLKGQGIGVRYIPSREGQIRIEDIVKLIDERTRLISISSVQFTNGFRIDLDQLGTLCRSKGVLLCIDAIQSLGIIPMDVMKYHVDFLSADAHKWLMGPEGIGIFYCRKGLGKQLNPPLVGWKSVGNELDFEAPKFELKGDARRFEEGSLNVMGIIGLGAAIELLFDVGIKNIEEQVLDLGDIIIREAEKRGFKVLGSRKRKERGGNITVSGAFDPYSIRDGLHKKGILVNVRSRGIRISPHFYNMEEEIQACFNEIDVLISKKKGRGCPAFS